MLAERIKKWPEQWEERGIQKGIQKGILKGRIDAQRETAFALLELKFGALPDWATRQLNEATTAQLDTWIKGILSAESLESLLGKH
jgi:hypothetical protein